MMTGVPTIIKTISYLLGLPPGLLLAICQVETGLNHIVNHNDFGSASYGACQVKLNTCRMFDKQIEEHQLTTDPVVNVWCAGKYLQWQLDRYNNNYSCAISAYNAGSCRPHVNGHYIKKVKKGWK